LHLLIASLLSEPLVASDGLAELVALSSDAINSTAIGVEQPWKWRGDLSHLSGRRDHYVGSDSNIGPNENGQDGRRTKAALLLHAEERQPVTGYRYP
jgi:hypothetical protein